MKPTDADFVAGDWSKPHALISKLSVPQNASLQEPDRICIKCSCGWRVTSSADLSERLAKIHLDRAFDRAKHKSAIKTAEREE